ncbi:MAG: hypothetical protein ACHQ7N_13410 [Candidatus Methylomirabilales bacterium]
MTFSILRELKKVDVEKRPMGTDLIDQNMITAFKEAGINWTDGVTPMMRARAVKNHDEHECLRICAAICDATHYEISKIIRPGITENEVTGHAMKYLFSFPAWRMWRTSSAVAAPTAGPTGGTSPTGCSGRATWYSSTSPP